MDCTCDNDRVQCIYERQYAEMSSSSGVLGEDILSFGNESELAPQRAVFGCENVETGDLYSQHADGIMGLGRGDLSVVDQLVDRDYERTHCTKRIPGPDLNYNDICFSGAGSDVSQLSNTFPVFDMGFADRQMLSLSPENYLFRHSKVHGAYCLGVFQNGKDPTTLLGVSSWTCNILHGLERQLLGPQTSHQRDLLSSLPRSWMLILRRSTY